MSTGVGGHQSVYRSLLRLFPAGYRATYGDSMVQLFSDQVRDEGAMRAWLRTAQDLPTSVAAERARNDTVPGQSLGGWPSSTGKLLGLLGIAGGFALLAAFVFQISPDVNTVRIFLMLTGGLALVIGTHRRQRAFAPTVSTVTAALAIAAIVGMIVMETLLLLREPPLFGGTFGWVFFWATIAWAVIGVVFWLAALRIGAVNHFGSGLIAVGTLLSILGIDRLGLAHDPLWGNLALLGLALSALGGILVGADLVTRRGALRREAR